MKYIELVITFMKISVFGFGGGYAMVPFFEKEISVHHWTTLEQYAKVIAISQIIPGPFAIDSSAYLGYMAAGLPGAVTASIAVSLPVFILMLLVARFYAQFKDNRVIQTALTGVRPAVIGLLASSAYIIGLNPLFASLSVLLSPVSLLTVLLILIGLLLLRLTKVNSFVYIAIFGALGLLLF